MNHQVCSGDTAKIHPLPKLGAAGPRSPPGGENGAPRPTAVSAYAHQLPRRPPSPAAHQHQSPMTQTSPSTVVASPQQTPGPLTATTNTRSAIACVRCRRSKTKCQNEGIGSTCRSCATANRECSYEGPSGVSSGASLRRESTVDGDGPPKKRRKPLAPTLSVFQHPKDGLGTYEDALHSPLLTAQVWEELFDIYEKHLAMDFPFLHKRTFLSAVQQHIPSTSSDVKADTSSSMPQPHYPPLLLAFLTQTARFHTKLVEQKGNDPIATADFYAEATRVQMGNDVMGEPTLEKIQALLMLGYHEWTALQGRKGWFKIGAAIRGAQGLQYQLDDIHDDRKVTSIRKGEPRLSEKDQFILRETQRRTFWSCCLMDRYLSWGKDRPPMLQPEDLKRTQLVCSDGAFTFGRRVRTRLLGEDDVAYEKRRADMRASINRHRAGQSGPDQVNGLGSHLDDIKWEVGDMEGELIWYIQVVDLFGEIVEWSCAGGRRQEGKTPPWHRNTTFKHLDDKLQRLRAGLPEHLRLTPENTEDRIYNGSAKEYMAMSPWTVTSPRGPLEEPLITEKPPHPEYWINQAKTCWGACKDFVDLLHSIESSRAHNNLIETPTVAFASFTVALCTIYCHYFPSMDPDRALDSRLRPRAHDIANGFLLRILNRFTMARSWIIELAKWQRYYRRKKALYKACGGDVGDCSPLSSSSDSNGSGLRDYALQFEQMHKQFGSMETNDNSQWADKDLDMADANLPRDEDAERSEPSIAATPKREKREASEEASEDTSSSTAPVSGSFVAVNSRSTLAKSDTPVLANVQVPTYERRSIDLSSPAESTSRYRTQGLPTSCNYHPNTATYPQTNVSATRSSLGSDHSHSHSVGTGSIQAGSRQPDWPLPQSTHDMDAARSALEREGFQPLENSVFFSNVMKGDNEGFEGFDNVHSAFTYDMQYQPYATSNNIDWSPAGPGQNNYAYQPPR